MKFREFDLGAQFDLAKNLPQGRVVEVLAALSGKSGKVAELVAGNMAKQQAKPQIVEPIEQFLTTGKRPLSPRRRVRDLLERK